MTAVRSIGRERQAMIPGLVTNCFRCQFDAGASLAELIDEAQRRGFRAIELRQGSLGEYESAERLPDAGLLAGFPRQFPAARFNVALELPFLSGGCDPHSAVFSAGKWAADAVAGESPPHLRLVDLQTTDGQLRQSNPAELAARIEPFVSAMEEIDGVLSLENSRQDWGLFRRVFEAVRERAGPESGRLKLCYDPCNLLTSGDGADPADVTAALSSDEISLLHFKQRREGGVLPLVDEGEIDWPAQIAALKDIRYVGPGLFEVAPGAELWTNLDRSREFLARAGIQWTPR